MCGYKNRYIVKFQIRPASVGLTLLVLFGIFFVSCDEVQRHEALIFFFDGVPPLGSENLQEKLLDPNTPEFAQADQAPVWYVHEPRKDCSTCHGKRKRRSFSSQIYLNSPVPKLCYNCHTDYTVSASFVHGPVAVGQCLFCHNPHRSKIEHLLTEPEPKLCYLCHDINTIKLIPAHLLKQLSACTECHYPHASSDKALLKENISQTNDGFGHSNEDEASPQEYIQVMKEPYRQSGYEPSPTNRAIVHGSQMLSKVFRETSKLIEQGKLQQAREYLEKFRDNAALTTEERSQIEHVLVMIDSVITNKEQQLKNDKQSDKQIREITELYYSSMAFYRTGQLIRARDGFVKILNSGLIPDSMTKTILSYITDIDNTLAGNETSTESKQ